MNLIRVKFYSQPSHIRLLHIIRTMTHKVFVYGTLKRNEPNHSWIRNEQKGFSKYICDGVTKAKYPLIIATKYNIPFLLYKPGEGYHVHGEIYEVDDAILANMDVLEDHPNYYVREIEEVFTKKVGIKDETVKCWIYFLKNFKSQLLSQPFLDNYSSQGSHGRPYMERSKREPLKKYNPKDEVNNESTIDDIDEDVLDSGQPAKP